MRKIIFHIDVNSAYLSWTAVEELKKGAKSRSPADSCDHWWGSEVPPRSVLANLH